MMAMFSLDTRKVSHTKLKQNKVAFKKLKCRNKNLN